MAVTLVVAAALTLGACAREEKIIDYKPFLAGLQDAKTQTPAVLSKGMTQKSDGEVLLDDSLIVENPDGTQSLISRNGRQLMYHIRRTLEKDQDTLFAKECLAEITRAEFRDRGLDPVDAFKLAKASQKDILKLFSRMPLGEHSPNVLMEPLGRRTMRVILTGKSAQGLKYRGFDMVLERGNWKLRWFV